MCPLCLGGACWYRGMSIQSATLSMAVRQLPGHSFLKHNFLTFIRYSNQQLVNQGLLAISVILLFRAVPIPHFTSDTNIRSLLSSTDTGFLMNRY